jgi:hypothetical protein
MAELPKPTQPIAYVINTMMLNKLIKFLLKSVSYAVVMIGLGCIIKYVILDTQTLLQDILFYVGATPIALFSIGFFGDFFGKGTIAYQQSRSVSAQSSNERAIQDQNDTHSRMASNLRWIVAGLLVWGVSYCL